jgi:tetratricopeptide (TPR) repeat protein
MSGAFDFYVDESLLQKLLNDEPEEKEEFKAEAVLLNSSRNGHSANGVHHPTETTVTPRGASPVGAWVRAEDLLRDGDFEGALVAYELAIQDSPDAEAVLRYNIGICHLRRSAFDQAVAAFQAAVEKAPDSETFALGLGSALLDAGRPNDSLEVFQNWLQRRPGSSNRDLFMGLATAEAAAGRLEQALKTCDRLLELSPDDAAALEYRLSIASAAGNREEMVRSAEWLLELDPNSGAALRTLLEVAVERREAKDVVKLLKQLRETDPATAGTVSGDLPLQLAASLLSQGDSSEAAEVARLVLEDPEPDAQFEAHVLLGEALYQLGEFESALGSFEKANELHHDDAIVLWNLAILHEQLGNLPQAAEALRKSILQQPEWAEESLARLAAIEIRQEQYEPAAATLSRLLSARSDSAEALFQLGGVLYKLGEFERSQDLMMKAIHLKPSESSWIRELERIAVERGDALLALDCHEKLTETSLETPEMDYNLGVVMQSESELELAAKFYLRALEKKPDLSSALLNLGHTLEGLGRTTEARTCWGKAIRMNPELAVGYFH